MLEWRTTHVKNSAIDISDQGRVNGINVEMNTGASFCLCSSAQIFAGNKNIVNKRFYVFALGTRIGALVTSSIRLVGK